VSGHLDTQKFNQLSSSLVERVGEEALHKLCVEIAQQHGFTIMAWAHKTGLMELRAKRRLGFLGQTGGVAMLNINNPDIREVVKAAQKQETMPAAEAKALKKAAKARGEAAVVTTMMDQVGLTETELKLIKMENELDKMRLMLQEKATPAQTQVAEKAEKKELGLAGKAVQAAYDDCTLTQKFGVVGASTVGAAISVPVHTAKHTGLFVWDTVKCAGSHIVGTLEDTASTYRCVGTKTTMYFKPEARALIVTAAAMQADPAKVYAETGLDPSDIDAIAERLIKEMQDKAKAEVAKLAVANA
jgi:hypothetical protein